jgi:hypothetical protein
MRPVDPARSRIVLVGTPAYREPRLPDVPVIANNLTDLAAAFTDPQIGGFDVEHCVTVPAGAGVAEVGEMLVQAADQADDLLLFYYSGHGLLGPRRRELYLSLAGTRSDQLAFTALPFDAVRDACLESRAENRVVIVDSCFSGRAIGETLADGDQVVLDQLEVSGTYTLTSAPANRTAVTLPGEVHTAFTERLLALMRQGNPHSGEMISLGDIYRHLHRRLRAEGLPVPQQRGTATADLLGLVKNRQLNQAPRTVKPAELPGDLREALDSRFIRMRLAAIQELGDWLAGEDPSRVLAARAALESVAARDNPQVAESARALLGRNPSITSAGSLTEVSAVAHTVSRLPSSGASGAIRRPVMDRVWRRSHATALLAEAEGMAAEIDNETSKTFKLARVARELIALDSDSAERIIDSIADTDRKVTARAEAAGALAATDPDAAERLAERASYKREMALELIANAVAKTDPDRAERIVAKIQGPYYIAPVLIQIAHTLVGSNHDRAASLLSEAERVTMNLDGHDTLKVKLLSRIGEVLALVHDNPQYAREKFDEAERIYSVMDAHGRSWVTGFVGPLAAIDPDRAERTAMSIIDLSNRPSALAEIARVLAARDPNHAERIAATIAEINDSEVWQVRALAWIGQAVGSTDPDRATRLFREAERIARNCPRGWRMDYGLRSTAEAVASSDPDYAVHLASDITDRAEKVEALADIAHVFLSSTDV